MWEIDIVNIKDNPIISFITLVSGSLAKYGIINTISEEMLKKKPTSLLASRIPMALISIGSSSLDTMGGSEYTTGGSIDKKYDPCSFARKGSQSGNSSGSESVSGSGSGTESEIGRAHV